MDQVTHPGLDTVLSATDLIPTNAVRFGSARSSCSPHGRIIDPVPVADAVAASAAYPLLLPALNRTYGFRGTGHNGSEVVAELRGNDVTTGDAQYLVIVAVGTVCPGAG